MAAVILARLLAAALLTLAPAPFPSEHPGWHPWYMCIPQTEGDASCYYAGAIPAPWRIYIGWDCTYGTGSGGWQMTINGHLWSGYLASSASRDFYGATSYVDAGPGSTVLLSGYGEQCLFRFRIGQYAT